MTQMEKFYFQLWNALSALSTDWFSDSLISDERSVGLHHCFIVYKIEHLNYLPTSRFLTPEGQNICKELEI